MYSIYHRSQLKVLQQPPDQSVMGSNPLSVIGPMLFPPGSSNIPFQQLAQMGQNIAQQMTAPGGATQQSDDEMRARLAQPGAEALLSAMGIQVAPPVHKPRGGLGTLVEVEEAGEGFEEVTINDIPEGFQPKRGKYR